MSVLGVGKRDGGGVHRRSGRGRGAPVGERDEDAAAHGQRGPPPRAREARAAGAVPPALHARQGDIIEMEPLKSKNINCTKHN